MKFAITVALLVSTLYANARQERIRPLSDLINSPDVQESYFRVNKMYTFQYDGQINIGVPDHSDQQSSSRIQAEVSLVKRSDEHFIIRCRNIKLAKQLSRLEDPRQIQSFDKFEKMEINPSELATLELPVEFTYAEGQIQDLVFQQQEEDWSANMKRGIINMLQIKLQPKDRISMEEEQSALNKLDTESKTDVAQVYRTQEKTVEGECNTMYSINSIRDRQDEQSSSLLVTKTIDLNSCQQRPKIKTNFQFTQRCPRCKQVPSSSDRTVQSSTVLRFQIRGKRDKFLVESVQLSNDHVFAPQNSDENTVVVTVRASLHLTNSQEASQQSIELSDYPQTGQKVSDLIYSTETEAKLIRFQTQGDRHFSPDLEKHPYNEQNKIAVFGEMLTRIIRHMRSKVDEQANRLFYEAVALARMMKESEVQMVHQQYFSRHQLSRVSPEEREKIRNILPHIFAQAGTYNTIKHLVEKISNGEISPLKAAVVVPSLMNAAYVSQEMVMEMLRLVECSAVQQCSTLKKSVWLTIGSLMRTACKKQDEQSYASIMSEESRCSSETKQRFVRLISDRLRGSDNWEDKILYLRVLGNAGLDSSVQEIENILSDKSGQQSSTIRMEAILALRHLRSSLPQKSRSILLATATNKMESSAVRMAAIQQLLQDSPGKLIIDQLVTLVNHDRNRRVASFAYRLMKSLAMSKQSCYEEMNRELRSSIKRIRRSVTASMPVSDVIFESMHDAEKKYGVDMFLLPFYNSDEIVPKFLRAGIHQSTRGKRIKNLLAVEMGSSGLSSIFSELMQTEPEQQMGSSEYRFNLQRLADKLQRADLKSREPKSWMSLKFKNQDVFLYTLNEENLKEMLQSDSLRWLMSTWAAASPRQSYNIDEATLLHETSMKIPTALGTQLRIKSKIPAMLSLNGQASSEWQSASMKGRMQVKGKLNAVISMVTDVSSQSPILTSGIYLIRTAKLSLPIDLTIQIDPRHQEEQLKIEINHSQSSQDLFKLESRPVIYIKRSLKPMKESEEKTIVADRNTKMESFKQCMRLPIVGSEFCARGLISKPNCQHSKFVHYLAPWFGPNKVVFSAYPTMAGQRKISLSGSARRLSIDNQDDMSRSYMMTMQSGAEKQILNVDLTKSAQSIMPSQMKATYTLTSQQGKEMHVCMQMSSQRIGGAQQFSKDDETAKMKINTKINWGSSDCRPENYLQATVETATKRKMHRDQIRPMSISEEQSFSSQMGRLTSREETAGCKINLNYGNVPEYIRDTFDSLLDFLIHSHYWNTQIQRHDAQSPSRSQRSGQESIRMIMTEPGKADIRVETDRKTVLFENVRIPAPLRYEKLSRSNLVRLTSILVNSQSRAVCQSQQGKIRTFDNAVYKFPLSNCYTILTKDENSRFTIMVKRSESQPDKMAVKVITQDHEIKLKPEHRKTIIYLDGNQWQEDAFVGQRSFKISRSGEQVIIHLVKYNVDISTNGEDVIIMVPEQNHGRQQGLCGNLNADSSDEFGQWHSDERENFKKQLKEMTLADGQCDRRQHEESISKFDHQIDYDLAEEMDLGRRQIWNQDQSDSVFERQSEYSRQSSDNLEIEDVLTEVAPVRQNIIITKRGKHCISISPVEKCPEHSYVADNNQVEREVQYTCLSRHDPLLSSIAYWKESGHSTDLAGREISFSRKEYVPRKCVAIV